MYNLYDIRRKEQTMNINLDRLRENLLKVGEIGRVEGEGITRLAFSKEYYEASKVLLELMRSSRLEAKIDELGNVVGKRQGLDKNLPSIMIGSHLDTVKNGGLFDGNLGIIAGLELINYLKDNDIITNHPIEIVAFNAEEGSEMGGTFCSRVMMGLQNLSDKELESKLGKYGLSIEDAKKTVRDPKTIKMFLELHVEQGEDLYSKNIPIGIVEGISGITRYKITSRGEANHSGTTPMIHRKDALIGASRLILEVDKIAKGMGEPFVATVGVINAFPGSVNVIPGRVEMILELRALDQDKTIKAMSLIKEYAEEIENTDFEFELNVSKASTMLNQNIIKTIEESCIDLDLSYQIMASGAGHDANAMGKKVHTGMIFVPSKDGKSHCPEEWTDWNDIAKGVSVLIDTVLKIDKQ